MRKLLLLATAIFTFSTVSAQNTRPAKLFHKYKGEEGIFSIWVPGVAIKLACAIADLEKEETLFLKSVRSVRILTVTDQDLYRGVNFVEDVKVEGAGLGYKMLIQIQDDSDDVVILGRERKGKLRDMLVLIGGEENVMIQIKGRMRADMVSSIANIAGLNNSEVLTSL